MRIEAELTELSPDKDMVLAIGVFDGVHLGHKYLISQLTEQARQHDMLSGVVTFRQHPREVLSHHKLVYLTDLPERIRLLKNEGVDAVIALSFNRDVAQLGARHFVELLVKHLRMRGLVIGPDFSLGRNREGNADTLRKLGQEMRFSVTVIPQITVNGQIVRSTMVRDALTKGDVKKVNEMTGRPFNLKGTVTTGAGRGSKLGFPTVNLDTQPGQSLPADGVYATWAFIDGQAYQSITNIGLRPTFDGEGRTVETYIINYKGNLYGQELKIDMVERLRGERRFDTVEELKKQIAEDVKQGVGILDSRDINKQ